MAHPIKEHEVEARELSEKFSTLYFERAATSDQQAIEIAKMILQSLFLLHGGALVAVPTFANLLTKPVAGSPSLAVLVAIFTGGMLLAILAALSGFFSLSFRSDYNNGLIGAATHRAWAHLADVQHAITGQEDFKKAADHAEAEAAKITKAADPLFKQFLRWRTAAIRLILGSVMCLAVAAFVAVLSIELSTTTPTSPV